MMGSSFNTARIASDARLEHAVSSAARPFVLATERELSVLRRSLTKHGWKRALYLQPIGHEHGRHVGAGLLCVANRWVEADIEIPHRAGRSHHLLCHCGTRLAVPDTLEPAEHYTCPACGKQYSGEEYDDGVRYVKHNSLAGAVLSLALIYNIEKDRAYADKAAQILLEYAHARWEPHEDAALSQSPFGPTWIIPLAQAYDLMYYSRSLDEQQKDAIESRLFRPTADRLKDAGIDGPWGSWNLSAVGVVGMALKDASLVRYALDSFASQIAGRLGDDGLWPGSLRNCHLRSMSAFMHLAEGCRRMGIDIYNWEAAPGRSLKAMFLAPLQYVYPSFRLPAVDDGRYNMFLPLELYEIAHRRWDDQIFAWVLKQGYRFGTAPLNREQRDRPHLFSRRSLYALLFGRDFPARFPSPVFTSRDSATQGTCTLRNQSMMATLSHGLPGDRGHLDKLSFTLYANDSLLIPDYGTPGYGPAIVDYYRGTASHNTVVVDGRDQRRTAGRALEHFHAGSLVQCADGVATDCYPGVTHTRRMLMLENALIIRDIITSDQPHDYDWLIRCEGEPEIVGEHAPSDIDCDCYPLMKIMKRGRVSGHCRLNWTCEQGGLAFRILTSSDTADIALGECPAETAARTASFLMCRQRGRDARFLAVLVPSRRAQDLELAIDGCVTKILGPNTSDHIYLSEAGEDRPSPDLQTDGEVAAVSARDGQLASIVLAGGSRIECMGESIVQCSSPVHCLEVSFAGNNPVVRYCADNPGVVKLRTNARAIRVNGYRAAAARDEDHAVLRVTRQMMIPETAPDRR